MDGLPNAKSGLKKMSERRGAKNPIDGPIPGQSLTLPPRTYPFDRPPQFVEAREALDDLFRKLMSPKIAKKTLAMLETGMPIMVATEQLLQTGWAEGKYSVQILPQMAAPVALMLAKMAHEAGIKANYTREDLTDDKKKDVEPEMMAVAKIREARKKKRDQAAGIPKEGGFLPTPNEDEE